MLFKIEPIEVMMEPMLKSQTVRIADIVLYGPFMIYVASKYDLSNRDKILLTLLGIGTVTYNLNNYLKYNKIK